MKMGNSPEKTQPPESPFVKGDLTEQLDYLHLYNESLASRVEECLRVERGVVIFKKPNVRNQWLEIYNGVEMSKSRENLKNMP